VLEVRHERPAPLPHDAPALHVTGAARYVDDIPTPRAACTSPSG
jgi:xanthine dehydrogenase molybdopterin-binding subunit B